MNTVFKSIYIAFFARIAFYAFVVNLTFFASVLFAEELNEKAVSKEAAPHGELSLIHI